MVFSIALLLSFYMLDWNIRPFHIQTPAKDRAELRMDYFSYFAFCCFNLLCIDNGLYN